MQTKKHELPTWFYWGIPIFMTLLPYVVQFVTGHDGWLYGESGLIENATVIFLFIALAIAIATIQLTIRLAACWLTGWGILLALGTIYFAGEEMSWGQHLFGWQTPEAWKEINDQVETNLHNTSAFLDQIPRLMLTLAAFFGGICVPLYQRLRRYPEISTAMLSAQIQQRGLPPVGLILPTWVCLPVAALICTTSPFDVMVESAYIEFPSWLDTRGGELKECLIAIFIMTYIASLYRRLRSIYSH